jgi:hypothetical protein
MINRIYLKATYLTNSFIGILFYWMERKGFLKKVDHKIYKEIPGKQKIDLAYPGNYDPKHENLFAHNTGYESNDLVVYKFTEVNISTDGIVFKGMNNSGLSFPHTGFRSQYGWLYILKQKLFRKNQEGDPKKTYVLLFDFWSSNNYYHWLVDALPRFLMLKEEMKQKNVSLLLPETCGKYVLAIMKHFEMNEITFIKKGSYFKAHDLLLPYYTVGSGHIHPAYVQQVRQHLLQKLPSNEVKERIYVSRSRQKARLIKNEKKVIDVLIPLGFEIVYFEDYNFEEQVKLVQNAKILVTSHGANMTNCMFMPDNSKVLEIIKENDPNFCYWALATVTNKKYGYLLSKVVGNDHLVVDIEQFKIHLQKLLNE